MAKKKAEKLLLGFDLGATKLASGVITLSGKVLRREQELVEFTRGPEGFLDQLSVTARKWKQEFPSIAALGIGSCGPLDAKKGVLLQPTNFPRWGNIAIRGPLEKKTKLKTFVLNDAAAAAAAEGWVGGAKSLKNWMTLTLGTGLGTGVVIDRALFMGGSGFGPEAGHIILTDRKFPCGCGNFGCAEAVLSGTGLSHRLEEHSGDWISRGKSAPATTRELVVRAREGDVVAKSLFVEYAELLARAIHNYAVLFTPKVIFFSGGLSEAHDLFLEEAARRAEPMLKGRPGFLPELKLSRLGDNAGVIAGAWVAAHELGWLKRS